MSCVIFTLRWRQVSVCVAFGWRYWTTVPRLLLILKQALAAAKSNVLPSEHTKSKHWTIKFLVCPLRSFVIWQIFCLPSPTVLESIQ